MWPQNKTAIQMTIAEAATSFVSIPGVISFA